MAAIVVPTLAFFGVRAFGGVSQLGQDEGCSGTFRVRVAAAPEIVPPLQSITERIADRKVPVGGACLAFEITSSDPADTFRSLSKSETGEQPDLWIPDTWEWVARTGIPADRMLSLSPSVAASPLVLAANREMSEDLTEFNSWATLAPAAHMALGDSERSGIALSALLGVRRSLAGESPEAARSKVGSTIVELSRDRVKDLGRELDKADTRNGLERGVPATEQQLVSYSREHPDADLTSVTPKSGTVLLDYPLVAVLHEKPDVERLIEAGSALMRFVDTHAGRADIHKAGFRDFRDLEPPAAVKDDAKLKLLDPVNLDDGDDVLRSWAAMSLDSKMLTVIDVSGSMAEAAGEKTRIELARDAAGSAVSYLPNTTEFGLWAFSENLTESTDYLALAPVQPLAPPHRATLADSLAGLPGRVDNGTGLYDTILAAYRTALNSYDSTRVNSVVLLTDACSAASAPSPACANEATPGITKDQLIARLENEADAARPVAVILVGLGPEADVAGLEDIAKITGGKAYRAEDPTDMEGIIIDALLRRQCGADCAA